ncbi:MAG TPA: CopD family protein [Gallionella sp.]|nr:CopD family protein [Gallionella sp.]
MTPFKLIHLLAVLVWVGGMFFAYAVLRPAAVEALQPQERMKLWNAVLRRFFNWVWVAIGVILVTGLYLVYQYGGIAYAARHVHIMLASGLAMMVIFGYVFFGCYVPFSVHVSQQRWKEAEERLGRIRKLVALNLALGLLTILIVITGMAQS